MFSLKSLRNTKVQDNPEQEEEEEAKAQEEEKEEEATAGTSAEGDKPEEEAQEEEKEEEAKAQEDEEEEETEGDEDDKEAKAVKQAVMGERKRIKALADLSASYPVDKNLVYDAQFKTGLDVGQFMEAQAKRTKSKATKESKALSADAEEISKIDSTTSAGGNKKAIEDYAVKHAKGLSRSGLR